MVAIIKLFQKTKSKYNIAEPWKRWMCFLFGLFLNLEGQKGMVRKRVIRVN